MEKLKPVRRFPRWYLCPRWAWRRFRLACDWWTKARASSWKRTTRRLRQRRSIAIPVIPSLFRALGDIVRRILPWILPGKRMRWDFTKDNIVRNKDGSYLAGGLTAYILPEDGTAVERAAMAANARRAKFSWEPDGRPGNFISNGLPPAPGGPYARPDVDDNGNAVSNTRRYKAAVIQTDAVLNKVGWHYPQQRFLTLWNDVAPTFNGERPPEPLFFRANSGDSIEYWHTNLVPGYYELDDFQVRTPTDIIGQHIHLVKFDVLASDGAANGFNYEDGTFSPDEVRDRIDAIDHAKGPLGGGLHEGSVTPQTGDCPQMEHCLASALPLLPCIEKVPVTKLKAKPAPSIFGAPPHGQNFTGAQTTIQLWMADR